MSAARRRRGADTQRLIATHLQANGFPYAEPAGAGRNGSDITGTPGIDWEIKARRNLDLTALIRQLHARDDGTGTLTGVGVIRPDGAGPTSIGDWPAILPLDTLIQLLRATGHGDPPEVTT